MYVSALYSVTVYTCRGGSIAAYDLPEFTPVQIAACNAQLISELGYLGITSADIIANSSNKYNCHAYAWHLKEGNSNQVWIERGTGGSDESNLSTYWDSSVGCFVQVSSEASADKIYYYTGDHSAVKSSVSGKYESKWGQFPVVRHYPTSVPYESPGNRRYYRRVTPTISGPNYFNTSGTFTIYDLPSGANVTINCYNPLQASRSGNVITVTNPYGEAGCTWLSATITVGNWTYTTNSVKFLYGNYVPDLAGAYHATSSYPHSDYGWCGDGGNNKLNLVSSTCNREDLQSIQLQGRILLNGTVVYTIPFNFSGYDDIFVEFSGSSYPPYSTYNLELRNVTQNANSSWIPITDYIEFVPCPYASSYSLYPNPNNGIFTLKQVSEGNAAQSSGRVTEAPRIKVRIYSVSQSVLLRELPIEFSTSGECTVNTGNLPEGLYVVQIFSGDKHVESLKMQVRK
jgi:hypothetical protein